MEYRAAFALLLILAAALYVSADGDEKSCCHSDNLPRQMWYLYTPSNVVLECHRQILSQFENSDPDITGYAHESNGCHQSTAQCTTRVGPFMDDDWCYQDSASASIIDDDDEEDDDEGQGANRFVTNFADAINNGCGNTYTVTRTWTSISSCPIVGPLSNFHTITVVDTTPPELKVPEDLVVECDNSLSVVLSTNDERFGQAFVSDMCTEPTLVENAVAGGSACTQVITRTFTANDGCATTTGTQTVSIVDTTPPIMEHPPNLVVECDNVPAAVPGDIDAHDGCQDTPLTATMASEVTHPGRCTSEFSLERVFTVADACGNVASHTQIIVVEDSTPPTVAPAPTTFKRTLPCNEFLPAPTNYVVTDTCDASPSLSFNEDITGDVQGLEYIVTRSYTAADDCGNSVSWEEVYVVDHSTIYRLTVQPTATIAHGGTTGISVNVVDQSGCNLESAYLVVSYGVLTLEDAADGSVCVNQGAGIAFCPITSLPDLATLVFSLDEYTPPLNSVVVSYHVEVQGSNTEVTTGGPSQTVITVT